MYNGNQPHSSIQTKTWTLCKLQIRDGWNDKNSAKLQRSNYRDILPILLFWSLCV